jgi:hypothetical protein
MSPGSEADVVGKILLVWRLATKDLRHRPAEAFLLLLAIATAAATLTLGLALHGAANNPYAATRAATNGPDVLALESPAASNASGHASLADLTPLEHASGVVAHGGPYLVTWAPLRSPGLTAAAEIQGRSPVPSSVDQPKLTAGSWVRPDGVVVEGGFAQALGLRPGDRISLGRLSFRVAGVAATAAIPNYPQVCYLGCDLPGKLGNDNPGLVWLTKTDAERVAALSGEPVAYVLDLKLKDPAQANDFANAYDADTSPTAAFLASWQTIRDQDATTISNEQLVLLTGSWLLALLALASVIVLVGGRMAGQTRRVGLVKAVGGTPALVATVMLFENVLVAWCAAGVGLLAGRLTAPLLTGPGAGLVGAPGAPALGASAIGLVAAMASGVAVAATFVPAVRAARMSTVRALDDGPRTAPQGLDGRDLRPPAGAAAAGNAPGRPPAAPARAQCAQRRGHGERNRRGADRPSDRQQPAGVLRPEQPAEPPAGPGDVGHLGHAHRPGRGQRDPDRLGDGHGRQALLGSRPRPWCVAPAGRVGAGRGAGLPGAGRRAARHPGWRGPLRRRETRRKHGGPAGLVARGRGHRDRGRGGDADRHSGAHRRPPVRGRDPSGRDRLTTPGWLVAGRRAAVSSAR